jgi:hypothetical protein
MDEFRDSFARLGDTFGMCYDEENVRSGLLLILENALRIAYLDGERAEGACKM